MTTIKVPIEYQRVLKTTKGYVGLMGLSLGKKEFSNPNVMKAYASFMHENFVESVFLIADLPKIHNIMALDGTSWAEAEHRATMAGNNMQKCLQKIVGPYTSIRIARWVDFQDVCYSYHLHTLQQAYLFDHSFFGKRVDSKTMEFLELPLNKAKWKGKTPPLEIARRYVLDELAMLTAIPHAFERPLCEIYPGRNDLQEDIQARRISSLDCRLNLKPDRVFMEAYYVPSKET